MVAADDVRQFNRFWTRTIGLLDAGVHGSPYSLTEARVIFELAQAPTMDLAALRRSLGVDASYLTRIMRRLRQLGLATTERSTIDGRRQIARLTEAGRAAFADLDRAASREAADLLARVPAHDQSTVVAAMATVRSAFVPVTDPARVTLRAPLPGDLGWVVERHGALYAAEYGWDRTFEALVATIVGEYGGAAPDDREQVWIAEVDGRRAGCVFCLRRDDATAQLRLLLVEPFARGLGIGGRLVRTCIEFARDAGYTSIMLWTNDVLVSARRIYEAAGFQLLEEEPHHSFGHDLVGQIWRLSL